MPMIRETIVTTVSGEGTVHIAPLGLIAEGLGPEHLGAEGEGWIISPFRPSTTLDNLRSNPFAVANFTDDVLIFANCLTGKRDWPHPRVAGRRPRSAAILASRLHRLPRDKIEHELAYLQSAVEKTGGPREHEAWRLLVEKIEDHFKGPSGAPKC